jgi:hypothetical protein
MIQVKSAFNPLTEIGMELAWLGFRSRRFPSGEQKGETEEKSCSQPLLHKPNLFRPNGKTFSTLTSESFPKTIRVYTLRAF